MAGETIKTEAVCLDIRPWSRTSHVVSWLTPSGKVATVVKGAVRPKSLFLGQYDLNYECEILYYARAKGELHALRECVPVERHDELRGDYRKLALAGYFRRLVAELAPTGEECREWYGELRRGLDSCASLASISTGEATAKRPLGSCRETASPLGMMLGFELEVLRLSGLKPDFAGYDRSADWSPFSVGTGTFGAAEGRCIRISRDVAEYLANGAKNAKNKIIPLDAARVIGVFYQFHLDCASDVRRAVLGLIDKEGDC